MSASFLCSYPAWDGGRVGWWSHCYGAGRRVGDGGGRWGGMAVAGGSGGGIATVPGGGSHPASGSHFLFGSQCGLVAICRHPYRSLNTF